MTYQANLEGARTQEEDEQLEFEAACIAFQLRQAISDAMTHLEEQEVKAIIEQELQHKQRTH